MGSINLAKHLIWKDNDITASIDWEKLAETTHRAVRFLDDVITVNRFVPAIPELRDAAWKGRRIGLGYMGLADMLVAIGVRYGSPQGIEATEQITGFIQQHAMVSSIRLAKERGPFPAISGSIYDPKDIKWQPPDWKATKYPYVLWETIMEDLKKYGIRNAALTTVAPTGTIGTVAGVEGYGIEPIFALSYSRRVNNTAKSGGSIILKYASPLFARACAIMRVKEESEAYQKVLETGSCQNVQGIPEWIQNVFVTAGDLSWKEHVDMQACAQKFLSNSVSKTINFPRTSTTEDVMKAYMYAWKKGCCGLTVYVEGSRDSAVLIAGNK